MIFEKFGKKLTDEISDKELVARILSEQKTDLRRKYQEVLYQRYAQKVYHKCLSILRHPENAKDLTHDILVKVFMKLDKYGMESAFNSWVMTIAYNMCMDFFNNSKRVFYEDFESNYRELVDENSDDDIEALKEIKLAQLSHLIAQLPDSERILILMRYQDGMSIKEISGISKLGESAVKMRLKRSRDLLADLFKQKYDNE